MNKELKEKDIKEFILDLIVMHVTNPDQKGYELLLKKAYKLFDVTADITKEKDFAIPFLKRLKEKMSKEDFKELSVAMVEEATKEAKE